MLTQFSRTQLLFGRENMEKLAASRVAVFGIGGVGSYTVEALARSGLGAIDVIDDDRICLTNINRQLYALHSTIGKYKADVAQERIHDINPDCKVTVWKLFFTPETADRFDFRVYNYVVDCIDTVTGKIRIVMQAKEAGVPVISCMGAGNKIDPAQFEVADISKTSVCPLARVMRHELKERGIEHLKVVYSREKVLTPLPDDEISCKYHCVCPPGTVRKCTVRNQVPGSNAFVPPVAGLIIAGEVIKDLTEFKGSVPVSSNRKAGSSGTAQA
jgi:tRNA threonylcarbamoyladenosine dehydratase